jgi:hypothetical protein
VHETVPPGVQVVEMVQPPVGQAGQLIVPEVEPVQEPRWLGHEELIALLVVPVQVTVVPFQQLAVEVDLVGSPRAPSAA